MNTDLTLNGVALSTAVPSAYVLKVQRPLTGRRRFSDVALPGRAGSWRFDEEPGDRRLEVEIDIQAATFDDRRAAVRALAAWADVGTTANLVISDEPDRYHAAILDDSADVDEWLTRATIPLRFIVGPYSFASSPTVETISANTNPDTDSFTVPDETSADPVIELTPSGGNLTGFVLTVNGATVTWSGTAIPAGDTITISSISDTVTTAPNNDVNLTGAFDPDDVDMLAVTVSVLGFPELSPGSNTWALSWTGTATAVTVEITWRERFP